MAETHTTPEALVKDTTVADSDLIMKTDSNNVTKTVTAGNFFTWLWGKIKGSTKSTLDATDPTAPVNTNAVNGALANYYVVKTAVLTLSFIKGTNEHCYCALTDFTVANHLLLGAKVLNVDLGGVYACIGLIPYRYNSVPNPRAYWGLLAFQETGGDVSDRIYTIEVSYIDLVTSGVN